MHSTRYSWLASHLPGSQLVTRSVFKNGQGGPLHLFMKVKAAEALERLIALATNFLTRFEEEEVTLPLKVVK